MDTNKHESVENMKECRLTTQDKLTNFLLYDVLNDVVKVVVSILEHTTQQGAIEEKMKAPRMMRNEFRMITNQLSCISCLSWLKNIRVHLCSFVVPNGGAE